LAQVFLAMTHFSIHCPKFGHWGGKGLRYTNLNIMLELFLSFTSRSLDSYLTQYNQPSISVTSISVKKVVGFKDTESAVDTLGKFLEQKLS